MAKITGKNTRAGSNKATGRDYSKEKTYQSSPARNKYRAELNAEARDRGIYGKRSAMSKDLSHTKDGKMVLESKSLNRRRQGSNGKSTKK
jgi:hypothetical protein